MHKKPNGFTYFKEKNVIKKTILSNGFFTIISQIRF